MNKISIIEKSKTIKVGKEPLVLVPFRLWQKFEEYLEDQEALSSKNYLRKIKKARRDATKNKLARPFR